jgi:ribose 5-phosphate isomerase B
MLDENQVRQVVRQVVERTLGSAEAGGKGQEAGRPESPAPEAANPGRSQTVDRPQARRVVSEEEVRATPEGATILVPADALITPLARTLAQERRITIGQPRYITPPQGVMYRGQQPAPGGPPVGAPLPSPWSRVVALGADHGGFELKEDLKAYLKELGYRIQDVGTYSTQPVDYPDFALAVAQAVASGQAWRGIMVDGAGIGSCMAANKVPGVRAAMCYDLATAKNSREHNDANVLTLGGRLIAKDLARQIVKTFLETPVGEERHQKRVQKIVDIERRFLRR